MASAFSFRAAALSVPGAIVGGVLWLLIAISADLERAAPAILVGVFAGAATRLHPDRGRAVQIAVTLIALLGLIVVQYFLVRQAIVGDLLEAGRDRTLPLFLSPGSMWFVTFGWLRVYPIDVVFWALSLAAAWLLSAPAEPAEQRPAAPTIASA